MDKQTNSWTNTNTKIENKSKSVNFAMFDHCSGEYRTDNGDFVRGKRTKAGLHFVELDDVVLEKK